MKTQYNTFSLLAIATVLAMTLSGCKQQDIKPICFPWASESCTFSLSKYNSPLEIREYFTDHDSTKKAHDGDTIKICGWVYFNGPGETVLWPFETDPLREAWFPEAGFIVLVGNEDHHGYDQSIRIDWNNTTFLQDNPGFSENFDNYLQKKWYVTAKMKCVDAIDPPLCNNLGYKLYVITIDTIPNN